MTPTELQEIKEYWASKYPNVDVTLWGNSAPSKYYGKMVAASTSIDFQSDTIGDLIHQGENFLRKLRN